MSINFEIINMAPEFTNSVLVTNGADAVIFDPWGRAGDWERLLTARGLTLQAVYATHGHPDHIACAPMLGVPWYMNNGDFDYIPSANRWLGLYGMPRFPDDVKPPIDLRAGKVDILGVQVQVIETPGHSRGGLCFWFPEQKTLIIGDTIFQDTIGRYDMPGGDYDTLVRSVKKIFDMNLPDDTNVIHGHGAETTIGQLKKHNPYFG